MAGFAASAAQSTAKNHGPLTAKPARSTGSRISRLILGERLAKATHDSAERVIRQTGSSVTSLRGLGIGPQFARLLQTWARRRRIAIYATRDDIRVLRRRRLCVDERRQGGDKTPAGLGLERKRLVSTIETSEAGVVHRCCCYGCTYVYVCICVYIYICTYVLWTSKAELQSRASSPKHSRRTKKEES